MTRVLGGVCPLGVYLERVSGGGDVVPGPALPGCAFLSKQPSGRRTEGPAATAPLALRRELDFPL